MATNKVVKVEQVPGPPMGRRDIHFVPAFERARTNQTGYSSELLAYGTDSSLLPASRLGDDSVLYEDETEEALDTLNSLPDNWPKLPAIFRRRSCELTMATSPCVNKVVAHLELLQDVIEDWCRGKDGQSMSRQNTGASVKELRFSETRDSLSKRIVSASSTRASSEVGKTLSIQGVGMIDNREKASELEREDSIPYLGAEEAIQEVMTLLARLENDRQETEKLLERERERVKKLAAKIDHHRYRRLTELPVRVQKEHEECLLDINELQLHVAYCTRDEARIKNRKGIAAVLNDRLKKDVDFVMEHIPLVQEKLQLEMEAMNKIKNAQKDTNQELNNTKNRQEKTEAKSNEASQKALKERDHIKKELDTVREALSNINEELSDAKMTYNSYVHQVNDIEQQLKDNEQELAVLEVKNENAKVAEEMQAAKVNEINVKISETEQEHGRLDAENAQFQAELNMKKRQYSRTINELELAIKGRDSKLRKVCIKNQEVEMEVHDYQDKKVECLRQKDKDEKNVKRIYKEMAKIEQQLSVTIEEYNHIAAINATIRDQLLHEQERTNKIEESLKVTVETLKRQVKDEVHTKSILNARISSDSKDLTKSKGDIKSKKTKAAKVADDVVTAVKSVRDKVDKLRSAKENRTKMKRDLSARRDETVKQMAESKKRFDERREQLSPHHSELKEDVTSVSRRLDHIEWKSDVMNNKIGDMDKSQGMMDRLMNKSAVAIEDLKGELIEADIQLEAAQRIQDDLKLQLSNILGRIRDNNANHRDFIEKRKIVKRNIGVEVKACIKNNAELASKYRTLQNSHMVTKDQYINNFEDKVKVENAIKDLRELQALQVRMHGAMMELYKYRGLYNTSELSRMEDMSINNSEKVTKLQESMDGALKNITQFIQTEMTGDAIRKTAWENLQKQEKRAAAKQSRSQIKLMQSSSSIEVAS